MATNDCCTTAARRLSDLLEEQQEPSSLLLHLLLQDHDDDDDSATPAAARRSLLRGSTAAATVTRLALRWADHLLAVAGCFSIPCAATRQRFPRLPRAHRVAVAPAGDCGRQQRLSPVSVLDLMHSDDDDDSSAVPSQRDEHGDDDGNGKPSTSGTGTTPSPPSIHNHDLFPGKIPATETEEGFQRKTAAFASAWDWATVEADMSSWIPSLVEELDLSASPWDDWRRLVVGGGGEEEARQVAWSVEAIIFEEVRWEAVRDLLRSPQH